VGRQYPMRMLAARDRSADLDTGLAVILVLVGAKG
jgi:hypothetical protein